MKMILVLVSAVLIFGIIALESVGFSQRINYHTNAIEILAESIVSNSLLESGESDSMQGNKPGFNSYGQLQDHVPLEVLIEALYSEDFTTRMRAVSFIGYRGQAAKQAVPDLVKVLEKYDMRESALSALKAIGPSASAAIPALYNAITAYPEQPATRWKSAHALANIGEVAIPTLKMGADSDNLYERIWCRAALAKIEGPKSNHLQYLSVLLSSTDRETVLVAVNALTMIGPAAKPVLPKIIAAMDNPVAPKMEIAMLLARMGKDASPAIPQLVKFLDDPYPFTRNRAALALSMIGCADLRSAVPGLIRMLSAQEDHVRRQAAETLGKVGPAAGGPSVPHLIERLCSDQDEHVRAAAAEALGEIAPNDTAVHSALIAVMNDQSGRVRSKAAPILAKNAPVTRELIQVFIYSSADNMKAVKDACRTFFRRVGPDNSELIPEQYRRHFRER